VVSGHCDLVVEKTAEAALLGAHIIFLVLLFFSCFVHPKYFSFLHEISVNYVAGCNKGWNHQELTE
jgi:hypothetical protein